MSPAIAGAINQLCSPKGIEAVHLREKFPENTPDLEWITKLKKEKDWIIVSQDRFAKNKLEKEAFYKSDLLAFVLIKGWSHQSYWDKAHKIVRIWPNIIDQANLIKSGGVIEVPLTGKKFWKSLSFEITPGKTVI